MHRPVTSREVRAAFLDFFVEHDHHRIGGVSLLSRNDPTLLFVNSGMAPLKRYFTGEERPPHPDLCNVQPCIRTKDIDDVGDRHHLTLFEMLGSWSIDHYFKERAIELAFELLTTRLGFDPHRLYATVFDGDPSLPLPADDISASIWEGVGIPRDHIVPLGVDNFWGPAGDTGPCGPCTEVFYDTGAQFGPGFVPGKEFDTTRRYIEIWNAGVFMEYERQADGTFSKLPFTSVDTGCGLERLVMAMNGQDSVYDTDLMQPIVEMAGAAADDKLSPENERMIADHVRAATFILGEGVRPSNEGAGYIPRRVLRKSIAVVHRAGVAGYDFDGIIDVIIGMFGEHYPHLVQRRSEIHALFREEHADFERVISRGLDQLERLYSAAPFRIRGRDAFDLFATYGLPLDIVRDFARERGGDVDVEEYEREFRVHQTKSRVIKLRGGGGSEDWPVDDRRFAALEGTVAPTAFLGYADVFARSSVVGMAVAGQLVGGATVGDRVELIARATPFYAESGGQVGDTGIVRAIGGPASGTGTEPAEIAVVDTIRTSQGYHVHRGTVVAGSVAVGDDVSLEVDTGRRDNLRRNHSATHLLQAVLRTMLGEHVHQAGSLVEPSRLRFDFTNPAALTREQLYEVERVLNRAIFSDLAANTEVKSFAEAVASGALSMEGEKYGDRVRVVHFGDYSVELCGGTHVAATGDINLFRIISESSIASGVRRIVALTGEAAVEYTLHRDAILSTVAGRLKVGVDDVPERIERLASGAKKKSSRAGAAAAAAPAAGQRTTLADGTPYLAAMSAGDATVLRAQALHLAASIAGPVVIAADDDGQARVTVVVPRALEDRFDAAAILGALLPLIEGRGGGKPGMAMGGGPRVAGLRELLDAVPSALG